MYLGDPRENAICPASGTIWEEDNRVEERWFWNGSSRDLCNMNPDDYGTTIFYTDDAPSKKPTDGKNNMTLEVLDNGLGSVSYMNPPASDIFMMIKDEEGNIEFFIIPKDTPSPFEFEFNKVNPSKIKDVFIGPDEEHATSDRFSDEKYLYTISYKPKPGEKVLYAAIAHDISETMTSTLVDRYAKEAMVMGSCAVFMYKIAPVPVPGLDDMDEEDARKIYAANQIDLFILTTKPVTNVFLNIGENQTDSWDLNCETVTSASVSYYVSRFSLSEHSNVYDPTYQEGKDIMYAYKVVM